MSTFVKKRLLIAVMFIIITSFLVLVRITAYKDKKEYYDLMEKASILTSRCFEIVKKYKLDNGIEISSLDILNTGMIGSKKRTSITTTEGILEAKRTVCNPAWSALMVDIFENNGLKEGDEVGLVFSGSFPAMNIAVLAASKVYGLKTCVMASVGASYFGANDPNFTFFDMIEHLNREGVLDVGIDYVSLGGEDDIAYNFRSEEDKNNIINRINASSSKFIYEENFEDNIDKRLLYFEEKVPNIKMLVNVGGSMVSFGKGLTAFNKSGLFNSAIEGNVSDDLNSHKKNYGLIQRMLLNGITVFNIINIKDLCEKYDMIYDPTVMPIISDNNVYFTVKYNTYLIVIPLILTLGILILFYVLNRNEKTDKESRLFL